MTVVMQASPPASKLEFSQLAEELQARTPALQINQKLNFSPRLCNSATSAGVVVYCTASKPH